MSKENLTQQEQIPFVPRMLHVLFMANDAQKIIELSHFLQEKLLEFMDDDLFEDQDYRQEWQNNMYYLRELEHNLKCYSNDDIINQVKKALEILQAKEVAHA